jgi:hypothetical protein
MFNMNYLEPLKINNIDFNKICYPKIKENQNKKIILIKYISDKNKLKNFVFQTPTLTNLNKPVIFNDYAELDISLESKSGNINNFINFLNDLEYKIKEDAKIYASRWFNNTDEQVINFQKIIRDNNTIKIKLIKNNDFESIIQLNNDTKIDFDLIPENCWSKMILECYALWINSNNDFGIFFRPILISFSLKNIYNYKFIDDDSDSNSDKCNIPDTDIKNNIFIKSNKNSNNNNDSSQLECNILYNTLIENSIINQPKLVENISDKTSDNNLSALNLNNSASSNSKNEDNNLNNSNSSISSLESLKSSE